MYVLCSRRAVKIIHTVSLQSFMTCGQSVKELSFISNFLFLVNLQRALRALPSSLSLPDLYRYVTTVVVYIKRRWWSTWRGEGWHDDGVDPCRGEGWQVTWYSWWSIGSRGVAWWQRRGVTWWWWWYLLNFFKQEINHLSGYCFPSLMRKFAKLTSDVWKSVLDDCWREVNDVYEHRLLGGRKKILFMDSWHFWKASHCFCWRCNHGELLTHRSEERRVAVLHD